MSFIAFAVRAAGRYLSCCWSLPAPEIPSRGFVSSAAGYEAPPSDPARIDVKVAPKSDRLQLLEPFPAWDGQDIVDALLLLKASLFVKMLEWL